MKYSQIFDKFLGCKNEDEVFAYLIDNLKETIKVFEEEQVEYLHIDVMDGLTAVNKVYLLAKTGKIG